MALQYQPAGRSRGVFYGMVEEDDKTEPLPSEFNTTDHPRFLAVSKDKLTVRYVGRGNHSQDVGAVRTNWPCPQRCLVYYFEVTIADSGSRGSIAIGLADKHFQLNRQPGWELNSYAYHGYDGRRYVDSERGEQYGPRFGTGDIIGCGLLCERREIFFTKNGAHLGVAFTDISTLLHPTIGLHSPSERVTLNLGATPFAFDIDGLVRTEREARYAQIVATPPPRACIASLVRGYLLHFNYGETLASLDHVQSGAVPPTPSTPLVGGASHLDGECPAVPDVSDGIAPPAAANCSGAPSGAQCDATRHLAPPPAAADEPPTIKEEAMGAGDGRHAPSAAGEAAMRYTLPQRRELRLRLCRGDVLGAIELVERLYPQLLPRQRRVHFRLRCQHFIELVRKGDAMAAVAFAQAELAPYQSAAEPLPAEEAAELADVFALIAYERPEAMAGAPSRLMSEAYREATADALNGAVLEEHGAPPTCAIERLLRQLLAVSEAVRDANLGYGDGLHLEE